MAAAAGGSLRLRQLLLPTIRQRLATGRQAQQVRQQSHGVRSYYMTEAAAPRQERTQLLMREAARKTELVALPLALVSLNAASLALAYYDHGPRFQLKGNL